MKKLIDTADCRLRLHALDLPCDLLVVGDVRNIPDDAEGVRELRPLHVGKHRLKAEIVRMAVVRENVILRDAILPYGHDLQPPAVKDDSFVVVLSEYHLFAVTQNQRPVRLVFPVGNLGVGSVVEYHAVRQELHDRRAFVP